MILTNGIIFIWSGTNASIPAGWSRVTDMDDRYPKGTADATNPNVTGGNATHTHTTADHTHTVTSAHTHTITVGAGAGGQAGVGSGTDSSPYNHTHANYTSGAVSGFSFNTATASYAAVSNNPPYYDVIFITPTTSVSSLPDGVVALTDRAVPSNFYACDGANGTPNLVDKFIKGAAAGGNAGGTGGSTTNIHPLSHTHATTHTHAAATSRAQSSLAGNGNGGSGPVTMPHTHSIALPASATNATTNNVSLTTSETVEPAYTKLIAIKASGEISSPSSIIALWLGTLANIPRGWILCDGKKGTVDMRGRHLKLTATLGEVGNTGGSNEHTHASQNHNHVISHSHSTSISHSGLTAESMGGGGVTTTTQGTTHAITSTSVNITTDNAATSANSSNNEPPYRTVAFIKLSPANPGEFILNFIH